MNKAEEYRNKNLHEGKWIESDEEFKRFLDKMNHKTLEDVEECTLAILKLVNSQAEDEGIWFVAKTAPEAYLQQELRKLHKIIEDKLTRLEKLKL